ncbi:MAG: LytT family two-component response regulator [Gemmatimonadetes bacterium]|nr:LytT family two-component response regulator [Gemmatimonadota bacterium]
MSDRAAGEGRRLRVLIVDDEAFNRLRLQDLVSREPGVDLVGTAADGIEAIAAIRALAPDVVFLDVQMPGKSGIDVVREVGAAQMPATIFVTAYDRYAVEAFEIAAIDYLVKPFDDERFEQAIVRARKAVESSGLQDLRERMLSVLGAVAPTASASAPSPGAATPGAGEYLERIAVDVKGTVRPVPVSEIDYIVASGPYAEIFTAGKRHLIRETMQSLEDRLDPAKFMRVHRSVIVRLELVEGLRRGAGGDGEVLLRGGISLRASRTRREALEKWLGMKG